MENADLEKDSNCLQKQCPVQHKSTINQHMGLNSQERFLTKVPIKQRTAHTESWAEETEKHHRSTVRHHGHNHRSRLCHWDRIWSRGEGRGSAGSPTHSLETLKVNLPPWASADAQPNLTAQPLLCYLPPLPGKPLQLRATAPDSLWEHFHWGRALGQWSNMKEGKRPKAAGQAIFTENVTKKNQVCLQWFFLIYLKIF